LDVEECLEVELLVLAVFFLDELGEFHVQVKFALVESFAFFFPCRFYCAVDFIDVEVLHGHLKTFDKGCNCD
jgi:hypothetical protein